MPDYLILALGFIGQGMFGARTIAQWIISEKEKRIVSPTIFWLFSVAGASIFLVYGVIRRDIVIIVGQTISFYIYARNLHLKGFWQKIPAVGRIALLLLPPGILLYASRFDISIADIFRATDTASFLVYVGIVGQLLLNFRYFYQWFFSEQAGESLLPLGFWIISAVASVMVVAYSIERNDIVLLVAQSGGLVAYVRNIYLHYKEPGRTGELSGGG